MPSKSQAQYRWAQGCLHNPRHMRGHCPSEKVAREFAAGSPKGLPEKLTGKTKKGRIDY